MEFRIASSKKLFTFTAVKQECANATSSSSGDDGRFVIQDLTPSYWTPGITAGQLVTCVVGHPAGSTASSSSSFVDDESTSYEDITYNKYGPSTANFDYGGGLYNHHAQHHQHQYNAGGYYDAAGAATAADYHHQMGYDDKPPPPYDNNNAADACNMNSSTSTAAITDNYCNNDDPYTTSGQIDRTSSVAIQQQVRSGPWALCLNITRNIIFIIPYTLTYPVSIKYFILTKK